MPAVPRQSTPVTAVALAPLLTTGLAARIGATPVRSLALMLMAQIWAENAQGNAVIQNNIGNLSAGGFIHGVEKLQPGDYWRPPWFDLAEIANVKDAEKKSRYTAQHAQMLNGEIPSAFHAWDSLGQGMWAYLNLIFRPVYQPLLMAAASGDALAFALELKKHYNPDKNNDPVAASKTLASFVRDFEVKGLFDMLPKVVPAEPAVLPSSPSWDWAHGHFVAAGRPVLVTLRNGMAGAQVAVWQKALGLPLTGSFDFDTEKATKDWQAKHGIDADGVVGSDTWRTYFST